MTMTDNSVFLSKNFLEFVVRGNYLLQESIRTLAEELKEKIGIKLPEELKLFQDTEIELKQKLGLKLFQDVEQEVEDEFPNRKEHSWFDGEIQRGVNFNKATDNSVLQICKVTSLIYLVDLGLKRDLFLKEQALLPISIRNAVEARVSEVTQQIAEKLGDVALDEVWKEVIRYHFRDHFQYMKAVLAALEPSTNATPFAPPATSQVPAQMSLAEGYQLYQTPPATQSVPPRSPQVVEVPPIPPLIEKPDDDDSFGGVFTSAVPILVGLAFFVGIVGFFAFNSLTQDSRLALPSPEKVESASSINNPTVIESLAAPADAVNSVTSTAPTSAETTSVVGTSQKPLEAVSVAETSQKPLAQSVNPKVSSTVIPENTPDAEPSPSHHSRHRSRHHKLRHGSRHHARE